MIEVKSNSIEGDQFIQGMMLLEKQQKQMRELFYSFIAENGFRAWHIHDGWLTNMNHKSGNIIGNDEVRLTWIVEHAGYSHQPTVAPWAGEKIVVVSNSPGRDHFKPFKMYCYEVVEANRSFGSPKLRLKLISEMVAIFSGKHYEYYTPPPTRSLWHFVKNFITNL